MSTTSTHHAMTPPRQGETIDIVRYAEVMAHLRHFPADKHAEVIARLGIRRRDWDAAAAKWKSVRDAERDSGKLEVTLRFGRTMAETRAKLEATKPPIESLGRLPGPDGEAPAQAAVSEQTTAVPGKDPEDAGTAPPAVVKLPATLLDPAAGDVPTRWGSNMPSYISAELRAAVAARVVPPLPALDAPPIPAPAMHPPPTLSVSPLPAAPVSSTPLIAPPPIRGAGSISASPLAGTADMITSAIVAASQQSALPFAPPQSSPAGVARAPENAPFRQRRSPAVGTGTVEADMTALTAAERALLPFARAEIPAPGSAEAEDDFDLSLLPLETYASVSGALARGESREATLKMFGLTAGAFEILAKAWAQRFRREPSLLEKFKELARSNAAAGRRGEGQR